MNNPQLLIAVTMLQQGLCSVFWLLAARLALARRPALHWAVCTGLASAAMLLILLRGVALPWLSAAVANVCVVAAFVALRRGIQVFMRAPLTDRENVLVLAIGVAVAAGAMRWAHTMLPYLVGVSLLLAWTLFRVAFEVRSSLAVEFGRSSARWFALPLGAVGLLYLARAVAGPFVTNAVTASIDAAGPVNTGLLTVSLMFALVLNATLVAMVITRLVRRLQYQSEHDALTGLLSRRPMEMLLQAEALRQRRAGEPYALLSIDIDHFKRINDEYGHATGDAVLARVAQTLKAAARECDSLARMGGEEFCALLPATDLAGARQVAGRQLEAVRQLEHPEVGRALNVTVSIGVAVTEGGGEPVQALLRRVDRALYAAKVGGRDRIEIAEPADAR